jgi:SAM-dependent methyltransferase
MLQWPSVTIDLEGQVPPRPTDMLIDRVTPGVRVELAELDRRAFDESGRQSIVDLEAGLQGIGHEITDFKCILDFGCGCARVVRWMAPVADHAELHGCDVDALAIQWADAHLPYAQFIVTNPLPPLPYGDGQFDLIINHSVFTHLDAEYQDAWLAELQRVLRPGGIIVLSVHGTRVFNQFEMQMKAAGRDPVPSRAALERDGTLYIHDDDWIGSSFPDFYHTTFHAPWYVVYHWSKWFDVRAYLPHADLHYQDMILMERVDDASLPRPVSAVGGQGVAVAPRTPEPHDTQSARSVRWLATQLTHQIADRVFRPPVWPPTDEPQANSNPSDTELSSTVRAIFMRMGERLTRLENELANVQRSKAPE